MSVCLHRYFSHKGFKCGRVTQFALYIGGCLASQVRKKRPTSPAIYVREPRVFHARRATRRRGIETRRGERGGGLALHVRAGRPNRTRDARTPRLEHIVFDSASAEPTDCVRVGFERFFTHVEASRTRET